jgi:hypothetical protein
MAIAAFMLFSDIVILLAIYASGVILETQVSLAGTRTIEQKIICHESCRPSGLYDLTWQHGLRCQSGQRNVNSRRYQSRRSPELMLEGDLARRCMEIIREEPFAADVCEIMCSRIRLRSRTIAWSEVHLTAEPPSFQSVPPLSILNPRVRLSSLQKT